MRSLIIGIHLAGVKEIALIGHTDCGGCLAFARIDTIIEHMQQTLRPENGAGDETARTIEEMDLTGHAPRLRGRPRAAADDRVEDALPRRLRGGGISAETSPPVSLTRTTNGRVSV